MIGNLLEWISPNTDLGTQHCNQMPSRQFRCVKRNKWNEPPRDYLSVKKSKKGPLADCSVLFDVEE